MARVLKAKFSIVHVKLTTTIATFVYVETNQFSVLQFFFHGHIRPAI